MVLTGILFIRIPTLIVLRVSIVILRGNTDIYNGTGIKDLKVYRIDKADFLHIEDLSKKKR